MMYSWKREHQKLAHQAFEVPFCRIMIFNDVFLHKKAVLSCIRCPVSLLDFWTYVEIVLLKQEARSVCASDVYNASTSRHAFLVMYSLRRKCRVFVHQAFGVITSKLELRMMHSCEGATECAPIDYLQCFSPFAFDEDDVLLRRGHGVCVHRASKESSFSSNLLVWRSVFIPLPCLARKNVSMHRYLHVAIIGEDVALC